MLLKVFWIDGMYLLECPKTLQVWYERKYGSERGKQRMLSEIWKVPYKAEKAEKLPKRSGSPDNVAVNLVSL